VRSAALGLADWSTHDWQPFDADRIHIQLEGDPALPGVSPTPAGPE
jgi:hypothetical protein